MPERTVTHWIDLMFGAGRWRITQDWMARGGPDLYAYGKEHGLDGSQHTGIDVGMTYGTPMYAPAAGIVVCGGTGVGGGVKGTGCGAFNDWGDGATVRQGVGRIELYYPNLDASLIVGHSRTCTVKPGDAVQAGQLIGTSGGMFGAHIHLEARQSGTAQGYTLIDPRQLFARFSVGEEQMEQIQFGKVPMYGFADRRFRVENKPEGVGWNNLGRRQPKFVALHRMLGSLVGTDGYFARNDVAALTDFGVGVEVTDGSKAGHIYQWSDPTGFMSGWASGPVSAPYGDGKRIVDRYGVVAVNRDGVSVEISGRETTPIDDVSWKEIVHLCAWWVDFMRIPYNTRVNPATGINYLIWHNEFTNGTGKQCPFDVVRTRTNQLYNDIAAFLRPYQTGALVDPSVPPLPTPLPIPEPKYAPPVPIAALVEFSDWEADSMKAVVTDEGREFVFVNDLVRAKRDTPRLQYAHKGSKHIGPIIKAGEQFGVRWIVKSSDGRLFYISPYWTRVLVDDTERIKDAA